MNEQQELRLNDYLDGLLPPREREAFVAEMESDPALRAAVDVARRIARQVQALPSSVAPSRDLWVGIEGRLGPRAGRGNIVRFGRAALPGRAVWPMLASAAALLLVAGSSFVNLRQVPQPRELAETQEVAAPVPLPHSPEVEAWKQAQSEADAAYEQARAGLLDALAKRKEELSPETRAVLRDNMAVIDNAVYEINLALADDPENPGLRHMLAQTREKELTLLEQLVAAPRGL